MKNNNNTTAYAIKRFQNCTSCNITLLRTTNHTFSHDTHRHRHTYIPMQTKIKNDIGSYENMWHESTKTNQITQIQMAHHIFPPNFFFQFESSFCTYFRIFFLLFFCGKWNNDLPPPKNSIDTNQCNKFTDNFDWKFELFRKWFTYAFWINNELIFHFRWTKFWMFIFIWEFQYMYWFDLHFNDFFNIRVPMFRARFRVPNSCSKN